MKMLKLIYILLIFSLTLNLSAQDPEDPEKEDPKPEKKEEPTKFDYKFHAVFGNVSKARPI